jgi:hypothetical protein
MVSELENNFSSEGKRSSKGNFRRNNAKSQGSIDGGKSVGKSVNPQSVGEQQRSVGRLGVISFDL